MSGQPVRLVGLAAAALLLCAVLGMPVATWPLVGFLASLAVIGSP